MDTKLRSWVNREGAAPRMWQRWTTEDESRADEAVAQWNGLRNAHRASGRTGPLLRFLQHQAPSQRTGPTHPRCGVLRLGSPRFGSLKPEEDFTYRTVQFPGSISPLRGPTTRGTDFPGSRASVAQDLTRWLCSCAGPRFRTGHSVNITLCARRGARPGFRLSLRFAASLVLGASRFATWRVLVRARFVWAGTTSSFDLCSGSFPCPRFRNAHSGTLRRAHSSVMALIELTNRAFAIACPATTIPGLPARATLRRASHVCGID